MRCLLLGPCPLLSKTMSPIPLTPGPWPCTCRRAPTLVVDSRWRSGLGRAPWAHSLERVDVRSCRCFQLLLSGQLHSPWFQGKCWRLWILPKHENITPTPYPFYGERKKNKTKAPTLAPEIIPRPSDIIYLWKIKNSPKLVQLSSICRTNRKWSSKLKIRLPIESGIRKNEDSKFDRATQLQRNPTSAPKTHKPRSPFLNLDRPPGTSEAPQTCKDRRTTGRNKENNQPQM